MENDYSDEMLMNARVSKWYDEIANTVGKCVFCDPREKYFITKTQTCFLTVSLFPYIDGQLLVVPIRHIEKFNELSDVEWKDTRKLLETGMNLINSTLGVDSCHILYREGGKSSGKSVGHLHFHLLPVTPEFMEYDKEKGFIYKFQKITMTPAAMAEKMRQHLNSSQ